MSQSMIHRSQLDDVIVPLETVHSIVATAAERRPDGVAAIDAESGRSITYRELDAAARRSATGFAARGVTPGDVVAIVAPNSLEWLVAALGVMSAGGIVTGANPGYTVGELVHQLTDSGARSVITTSALLDTVMSSVREAPCLEDVIVFGDATERDGDRIPVVSFTDLLDHDAVPVSLDVGLDELCALPYSSGTTGRSKGVQLTHRTLVSNITQVASLAPFGEGDRVLAFLPMFHIFGFSVVSLCALSKGATLVVVPGFDPKTFLAAIQDHRVATAFVVPPIANFLASHPLVDEFDLSALETVGCGAAPLGSATEDRLATRLVCSVAQGYGMTESSGVISYPDFNEEVRSGSSGRLLPNTQAMIIDPATGKSLGVGATGEIWFRGPQAFTGYLNNPEATAGTINADGWTLTGDLGHFDADGFLFITDRLKELIKVKGFQVAPAELEALLFTHPDVGDVAVIGRADERLGEVPVAYIVPRSDDVDVEAIGDWVADRVSDYKRLGAIVVTDEIPKNPSGKILRRVLREVDADRP